jgi:hypothetical protein
LKAKNRFVRRLRVTFQSVAMTLALQPMKANTTIFQPSQIAAEIVPACCDFAARKQVCSRVAC